MKFKGNDITKLLGMNRRNFIKLAVGGAIGTALSPLPWKLTDDIAIWTENLPWVPVPPVGKFSYIKSVCMLCPGGCGIKVRKVDERAVKIEGRTDYPVNPGGICPLGMGGLQLLYNEHVRFTGPMKRTGARVTGTFQAISWEEAFDILAKRISGLKAKGNINALAAIDGNRPWSTMSTLIERLLKAMGSPNYMRMQSAEDTIGTAATLLTGRQGAVTYDLENADYILSFGSGLLEGWGSPGRVINAWGLWRSGELKSKVQVVQVESRASNTASKADKWVPAKPGTETALVLGISHVIISEGLHDAGFIDKYSFGFSDFKSADGVIHKGFKNLVLENYSPEKVAEITGVDAEEIRSIARSFAKASAPLAICGRGKGALYGSLYESMSVLCLNALVGSINRTGGVFMNDPLPLAALPDIQTEASTNDTLNRGRIDKAGTGGLYPFSNSLLNNFADSVLSSTECPIDTMLVFSANPAFSVPDSGNFRKALEKIPFIVSFSPYRDETALMADLILPDNTYLEKTDDITWPVGLQYPLYGLSTPAVKALYDTKNSGDAIIELAKKIGSPVGEAFPWSNYEEVLKARAKGLFDSHSGMTVYDGVTPPWRATQQVVASSDYSDFDDMWKKLKENGLWYRPASSPQALETLFKTPTQKFEFYCSAIESTLRGADLKVLGIKASGDELCMPHFESIAFEEDVKSFPLRMRPYELINLSSGWVPNPPYLNKTLFDNELKSSRSFVDVNPDTAKDYNLKQGDRVFVESPRGRLEALVNLFEGAMPGIVFMPLGLGHSAYDDFLQGKGVNPSEIIYGGRDPLSGQAVWWNTPVRLTKA
jgi:menaquinone reductase, molybdopterin-binding-like subunit